MNLPKSIKERYRWFLNTDFGSKIYLEFKEILYTREDSLIQTLNNDILQYLKLLQEEALEVCDIGGGDGNRIIHILKYLHSKFKNRFRLDFIEQSKQYINSFNPTEIADIAEVEKFHGLFEDVSLSKQYDLVLLIHSIFAFNNGRAIDKVLSLPKQDGKIIVVSNSPQSFLAGLKNLVDEGYEDERYEIDDLQRDLEKRKINYSYHALKTRWAINMDSFENKINTILEWISLGSYQSFTDKKKHSISEYLTHCYIKAGDRVFFTEDEVVIIIPPS